VKPSRFLSSRHRRARLLTIAGSAVVAVIGATVLVGFHTELHPITAAGGTQSELATRQLVGIRTFVTPSSGITVTPDVVYGTQADGSLLTLDVCAPSVREGARSPLAPAVISIHGGSWSHGDKGNSDWRGVCEWLASEGFVAFSVNYRLSPAAVFPAAIDDVSLAVEWLRTSSAADEYRIDPRRIGVFGGSAGGNLAALLGARGSGPLTEGSRVAAVAELSGPVDLRPRELAADDTAPGLRRSALEYLGCESGHVCPQAAEASAVTQLDVSDPPVFAAASVDDYVPVAQATRYASELERHGIRHQLVTVPGGQHSIGILDAAMRAKVAAFLHDTLGR
jgi:acetyl esterase/lipase